MFNYRQLSKEVSEKIAADRQNHVINEYACRDEDVIRRVSGKDVANILRPAYVRDVEKIINLPYYGRYMDKTQVFSLYKNDDLTRRALHVQLVARIARNIGSALNLNCDLIEATALGHDIGHTPFGHAGERILSQLYEGHAGRYFNHNIHSARVLDSIFPMNLSLQTLDGIICHNGEKPQNNYTPVKCDSFEIFDTNMENSYLYGEKAIKSFIPSTLEGCVVRFSDIIAYLGKDRQDAIRLGIIEPTENFTNNGLGSFNAEIVNNLVVSIVENSYGKNCLCMDEELFEAFAVAKAENGKKIYGPDKIASLYSDYTDHIIEILYERLLKDAKEHNEDSYLYKHHIAYVNENTKYYVRETPYCEEEPNALVCDYIASMTDDYIIDLFDILYPGSKYSIKDKYKGYFD